jgi:membrane protease YdiL (CAAX protease family)
VAIPTVNSVLLQLLSILVLALFGGMISAWWWALMRLRSGQPLLPPATPRIVPWGRWSIAATVLTWVLVQMSTVTLYVHLTGRPAHLPLTLVERMTLVSLSNGLLLITVPLVLRLTSGAGLRDLGLEPQGFLRQTAVGVVAFLLVTLPVNLINFTCALLWTPRTHPLQDMVQEFLGREVAYLAALSAVVLAPAAEELVFRAVIQSWLYKAIDQLRPQLQHWVDARHKSEAQPSSTVFPTDEPAPFHELEPASLNELEPPPSRSGGILRAVLNPKYWPRFAAGGAIGLTSLMFALAHWEQWPAPVAIFFLSLALGTVYLRTGSLWSSFVFHGLFNGLSTMILIIAMLGGDRSLKKVTPPEAAPKPALIAPLTLPQTGADFRSPSPCPPSPCPPSSIRRDSTP